MRVKGHAYKSVLTNVYGDHAHLCECGDGFMRTFKAAGK